MTRAAEAEIPTAVIRHHQADPDSRIFHLNSEMCELHGEVVEHPRDVLIDKQLPESFTQTGLEDSLKSVEAVTVSIVGYMTHMCCNTTALQAFHRGYEVEFLRVVTGTLTVDNDAGKATAEELQTPFSSLSGCSLAK